MKKSKSCHPWMYMLLILLICLVPFLVANYIYRYHDRIHLARHYHGQLYRQMPQLSSMQVMNLSGDHFQFKKMHGKWLLLYVSPECCTSTLCHHNVYNLRAMRGILVKQEKRFHAFILMPDYCRLQSLSPIISKDDSVKPWFATTQMIQHFYAKIDAKIPRKLNWSGQHLFFIDPSGYLVMHFIGTQPPMGWLQDFKLLLKVAQHA